MKISSWNVNSVRARILNLLTYLKYSDPDILRGSKVDFSEELIGESFKISNPKTKSSCGCGISFSF